ncbi:MAG TPA: transglutaminase family protein [Burkholderiales bacterium]|nr:transglutaminase family protein [Burkholderiales bacterium]
MTTLIEVQHVTTYRYAKPVTFGEHRLVFRPRPGHDIRVLNASVDVSLRSDTRWVLDVFSNDVMIITPWGSADHLRVACRFTIAHEGVHPIELPIVPHAERYPFDYSPDEVADLGALLRPHYPDPEGLLYQWLRQFFQYESRPRTRELLIAITNAIKNQFIYIERDSEGTQTPHETLKLGSGSCRDFALLMMEAVRRLGLAARFVTGYLYNPSIDGEGGELVGAGATHAWLHVYLPGSGWVGFDPTNSIFGGSSLIRVAYTRDPSQAAPLTGSWYGDTGVYLGMDVEVKVERLDSPSGVMVTEDAVVHAGNN